MRRILTCFAVAAAAMALPAVAQTAPPADLLARALRISPAVPAAAYAYDFHMQNSGDETGTVKGKFDPSRPEGDRVTIYEAKGEKADAMKIDKRMEKNADGDIWCDSVFAGADGPVSDLGVQNGLRVVRFTPLPNERSGGMERKVMKKVVAIARVDEATGLLKSMSVTLPQPYKPEIFAKLERLNMEITCATAANGRPYVSRMETDMAGSAFGKTFSAVSTQTITNLQQVKRAG
ncbi:MAG: hypothetical protein R3C52_04725 [Hyphomonadaceae bacterium]